MTLNNDVFALKRVKRFWQFTPNFLRKNFLTIWGVLSEYTGNMLNPPPPHPLPSILRFWNYLFIEKSTNFSSCCYRLPLLTMKLTNINSKLYQFINLLTAAGKITDRFFLSLFISKTKNNCSDSLGILRVCFTFLNNMIYILIDSTRGPRNK